jgi:hypothetical protein
MGTERKSKIKNQKSKGKNRASFLIFDFCLLIFDVALLAQSPPKLAILPSQIDLSGPRATQRLIVEATYPDGHQEDLTARAVFLVANPKVAAIEKGTLRAAGDGETAVSATVAAVGAKAAVHVAHFTDAASLSFRNDVLSVMTKAGCNSGACHGAAAGKNGFHLSLRGYDPQSDYYTLTHQYVGRRVVIGDPADSLMLLKPTFAIGHGGGKRFATGSLEYQILAGWIAAGAPPPAESDARVTGLTVYPASAALKPGGEQQVLVIAKYSDGHTEDATRWAKYSSSDEGVATVDDNIGSSGRVIMRGSGESAITVWYQSQVAFARMSVPYPARIAAAIFEKAPRNNFIDGLVLEKLKTLHIPPSQPAGDAEFLRRVYLDAAGILPTPDEAERFVADTNSAKRENTIEALLARSEFVDYWAYKWSDLLLASGKKLSGNALWAYSNWIHQSVAANKPWDRFVHELLTGTGSTFDNGALNYFVLHREPTELSENFAKTFLGLSITCAHCHNHPLEKWTQNDYYQLANLFARVSTKSGTRGGESIVLNAVAGEVSHPRLGHPLAPRPLDGAALPADSTIDRREYLARWVTAPGNPYFARAIVNRVWENFMGRGLVDPVDDLRATNPASNEELLTALTRDFRDHSYDVRRLIVTIANSAAYQASSITTAANAMDDRYYSHYLPRRLPAEVLLDAYSQVTGVPENFDGFPAGTRALQLPDTTTVSYFLTAFGRPERVVAAHSERQQDSSMTQALHEMNGVTLNRKLATPASRIGLMVFAGLSDVEVLDHLYLAAFSRRPTAAERELLWKQLDVRRDQRRQALDDMAWALLTSKEFMFNH